jgi:hypothetical protein
MCASAYVCVSLCVRQLMCASAYVCVSLCVRQLMCASAYVCVRVHLALATPERVRGSKSACAHAKANKDRSEVSKFTHLISSD